MLDNLQRVKESWQRQSLKPCIPLSKNELIKAFAERKILISKDVIEVYSTINGFDENEMDSEMLTFWTIEKILGENKENSEFVYFADFLIDSHHYAFKFKDGESSSIYVHYSEKNRVKVADSFDEFFELYLNQPLKLFI